MPDVRPSPAHRVDDPTDPPSLADVGADLGAEPDDTWEEAWAFDDDPPSLDSGFWALSGELDPLAARIRREPLLPPPSERDPLDRAHAANTAARHLARDEPGRISWLRYLLGWRS